MQLGRHLRELWSHPFALAACIALAALAAVWSTNSISFSPLGVKPRKLEMASASTRAIVDSPKSAVLDLKVNTYNFQEMTNRGVLVGNVMASQPVREYIGRRAGVRPEILQVASPVTPDFPRPLASSGKKSTSDIADSPDQYRLSIQANPTVPMLDVYAQAPTDEAAKALANGAVEGMQDYLRDLAAAQGIPAQRQVHLEQLGRAQGSVINAGAGTKISILSFVLVFGVSSLTVLWFARIRRGWKIEAAAERTAASA